MIWDNMPTKVKERYTWENGTLYFNKSMLSNYFVKPIRRLKSVSKNDDFLLVHYVIGESEQIVEDKINITNSDKMKLNCPCDCINYKNSSKQELMTLLRMQISDLSNLSWYVDSIGWHNFDNQWFYCNGNTIFSQNEFNFLIAPELSEKFKMHHEDDLSLVPQYMRELICLNSIPVNICILYLITGLLRSLYCNVNVPPEFVLYMYGKTQTYKTTTAKYFFDIYNQQNGTAFALEDLTSSEAALQSRILEFRDCVFILDDLSDGATNARTMRKKNTVDDFIRTAANCNSRLTKSGNSILGSVYDCSLAITAEYLLEIESSINRTILIDMEKHLLDENVLKFYAKHPLLPIHFSELFIDWASKNIDNICQSITIYWRDHRNNFGSNFSIRPRLQNSLAILEISTRFLLEFLNFHKVKTNGLNNVFQRALKEVLKDEDSVLRSIQMKQGNMNIAQEIVNFINRGEIKLTYSIFEGEAYVKKDILYIQPACILRELNKNISNGGLSVNALSTYLGKNNLLKLDKSGDYTQKGDNKKRYYLIKLDVLQEIANTELVINSI